MKVAPSARPLRVVLTGGSRGFGKSLSDELRRAGHKVVSTSLGGAGNTVVSDARVVSDTVALSRLACHFMGGVDVWINNAAVCRSDSVCDSISISDTVSTNLVSVIHATTVALEISDENGLVVNIVGAGHDGSAHGCAGHSIYSATKAGVSLFSRAYDDDRVIALSPGLVDTEMLRNQIDSQGLSGPKRRVLMSLSVSPETAAANAVLLIQDSLKRGRGRKRFVDCFPMNLRSKIRLFPRYF